MNKINKIKELVSQYFQSDDVFFEEVAEWRTNLNYFVTVWEKKFFLRTNITKVKDVLFWGFLDKERKILTVLGYHGITPKIIHVHKDDDVFFLIMEMINGKINRKIDDHLDKVLSLIKNFQSFDYWTFHFLERYSLSSWYKKIIESRCEVIKDKELIEINNNLIQYLFWKKWSFNEEYFLTHNDFRADNIIITPEKAVMIDVEWMSVSDPYLDMWEYYVWWVFWDNFDDEKEYSYEKYIIIMNYFWYTNEEKQRFIFVLKFCSNFSWLSSHVSKTKDPENEYLDAMGRNKKLFYSNIIKLLKA